jgi:predicted O-methyltransferase YrrM
MKQPQKTIVLLGMMTKMPVAGNAWLVAHYLVGLRRLGFDVYYVEAHGINPNGMLLKGPGDDGAERAAAFIARFMKRFDLGDRWAYHALHDGGRCFGMDESALRRLYRSAALLINLHGGTTPLPEHIATRRLVYLGTDPVELEIELHRGRRRTIEFMEQHVAYFTWGLNHGRPDCRVPVSERFPLKPTPPPVVLDFWPTGMEVAHPFTTVGNWKQLYRELTLDGEVYHWSKHFEFAKVLDLPARTGQAFELSLSRSSHTEEDQRLLETHGWAVRNALEFSSDLDAYRDYLARSRGEFTVAKDQNVRLQSGWFSERSAQYLAAGRPVITQDTGFGAVLPVGRGLFKFATLDEAIAAVETVVADHPAQCRRAREIAGDCFNYTVVLDAMLREVGLNPAPAMNGSPMPINGAVTHGADRAPKPAAAASWPAGRSGWNFGGRLARVFGQYAETAQHPHVDDERGDLFHCIDSSSTELEVLNLLNALVFLFKPNLALETGTHRGLGAIAIAAALKANGCGKLHTCEIDPSYLDACRDNLECFDAGLADWIELHHADSLRFIADYAGAPFDFAFFDSRMAIRHLEFQALRERGLLASGAVCVFHDTSRYRHHYWQDDNDSPEMRSAVEELLDQYGGLVSHYSRGLVVVQLPQTTAGVPAAPTASLNQDPLPSDACCVQIDVDAPAELPADSVVELDCAIHNAGNATLASAPPYPVCVSYRWLGAASDAEGLRTCLPVPLAPGTRLSCRVRVQTPKAAGEHALRLTLVQEHVHWFDSLNPANGRTLAVRIVAPTTSTETRAEPATSAPQ